MRRLIALSLIVLGSIWGYGQEDRFAVNFYTELADKNTHTDAFDYGVNFGLAIEYQMRSFFFNAEIYIFPDLNGLDYFHLQGTILGINKRKWDDTWRYYLGILKPGFIIRGGNPYPMIGWDAGMEYYFDNGLYTGVQYSWDWNNDDKYWDPKGEGYAVWSLGVKFGYSW